MEVGAACGPRVPHRIFVPCSIYSPGTDVGVSQIEKSPKPVASCAMPAGPGMKIKTDTPVVKKAREGVMEFLLVSNLTASAPHQAAFCSAPLFCPGPTHRHPHGA